jgi:transposase
VQEAQWLLKLHTFGLLNNSFRPPAQIRRLRTNWRDRGTYVEKAGSCVQRMQKALTEMNIQLSNAISDLSGTTGMAILRAIVRGERSGVKLAEHRDPRIKATPAELASSLQGNWLPEQISVLKRQLKDYDHIQSQIADCDVELREILKDIAAAEGKTTEVDKATELGQRERKPKGNRPHFDLGKELARINGVDLTKIDGIDVMIAQTLLSEIGTDLSRWPTESHFVSWLGLCPDNEVSGGKVLRRGTRNVVSRAATALRMAAFTLIRSQSYLGSQYRRLRTKLGAPKAITAMAHKLARLIYRMLRYGQEYVDKGMALYEEKYKQQQIQLLRKQATKNGFILVPMKATT